MNGITQQKHSSPKEKFQRWNRFLGIYSFIYPTVSSARKPPKVKVLFSSSSSFLPNPLLSLGRLDLFSSLFRLGLVLDLGLDANATKDETDAEPLHLSKAVAVPDDGEDHGEHLAGDGDGDEDDGSEVGDGVDCFGVDIFR